MFGRRGENCTYAHPKLCFKYIINGCDPVIRCKIGKNCQYRHPPIYQGSMRRRECFNENCNKLHFKGTRRYEYNYYETEQQKQQQRFRVMPTQQHQRKQKKLLQPPQNQRQLQQQQQQQQDKNT